MKNKALQTTCGFINGNSTSLVCEGSVVCPSCGYLDKDKTFWATEMPFDTYLIECEVCGEEFLYKAHNICLNDEKQGIRNS